METLFGIDLFDVVIVAFTFLVLLSILLGSIGICVKCAQRRQQRRRLGPLEAEADRDLEDGDNHRLDKWPDMTLKQRQQLELNNSQQAEPPKSAAAAADMQHVQPIAGIIVVRPSMPLPPPLDAQMNIIRGQPSCSSSAAAAGLHRHELVNLIMRQASANTASSETTASSGGGQQQVAMHEMMEEHEPEQSSDASTSSTARRNDHLQGEEDEGHEGDKRLLERADEFQSAVWINRKSELISSNGEEKTAEEKMAEERMAEEKMAEERRKSEELAEDDEPPDTARRIDDGSVKEDGEEEAAEKEKMEKESEMKEELDDNEGEEDEKRETKAEQEERKMLGATAEIGRAHV